MRVARILIRNLKAHVDTPLRSPNEWILKEAWKPRARAGVLFHVLQFLPNPSDASVVVHFQMYHYLVFHTIAMGGRIM
jgi:hypothetical protein